MLRSRLEHETSMFLVEFFSYIFFGWSSNLSYHNNAYLCHFHFQIPSTHLSKSVLGKGSSPILSVRLRPRKAGPLAFLRSDYQCSVHKTL